MINRDIDIIRGFWERAKYNTEDDVKRVVRRILKHNDIFHFMPPANAYGKSGISDILAIGNARTVAIECKYKYNKPTPLQLEFGAQIEAAGGMFLVVNERNLVTEMLRGVLYILYGADIDDAT